MNVLLAGGAGYIGSHTCVELINSGHSVIIADNFSNSCPEAVKRVEKLTNTQIPLFIRESLDSRAKDNICKQAAALIKEGNTVFLDGSSTVQYLAKYMATIKDIIVVTYSIKTAELMCQNHIKTYCAGGLMLENSLVCVGNKAVEFATAINTDVCFISCKGVDCDGKFTDTSEEETVIRKAFMKNCKFKVMLMTQNKFNSPKPNRFCPPGLSHHQQLLFSHSRSPSSLCPRPHTPRLP